MSSDHNAVFLETDMSKEKKKHTHKTNMKNLKLSPHRWEKSEDLKIACTSWQETVQNIATTAGNMWMLHAVQERTRSCKTC